VCGLFHGEWLILLGIRSQIPQKRINTQMCGPIRIILRPMAIPPSAHKRGLSMKKTLMCATAAAAFASAGLTAQAEGWYSRADLQYTFDGRVDHDAVAAVNGKLAGNSDASELLGAGVGFGYGLDNGLRFEGAVGYRGGDLDVSDTIGGTAPGTTVNPDGTAAIMDVMINGIYDFNKDGTIRPYIGAGVGGTRIRAKASNRTVGAAPNLSATNGFTDTAAGLAWQGLAGIGFKLSDRLTLDLGYKYFTAEELEFDGKHTGPDYTVDYTDHTATIGLRYAFGVTPPPPPEVKPEPEPQPEPQPEPEPPAPQPPEEPAEPVAQQCSALNQQFVVYFEWDRSDLTSQASAVIDQAVANIAAGTGCAAGSVTIVGHTDTSGAPAYNEALSVRRADVVAAALSAAGITATIDKSGKGETALAKATNDGVREPLNRRSEVTIVVQ
jgi:outer membrane protein OmpA-like peptidoglycan-associated protein/outer membrane protein W